MYTHQHLLKMVIIISSSMMLVFTAIRLVFYFSLAPITLSSFICVCAFFPLPANRQSRRLKIRHWECVRTRQIHTEWNENGKINKYSALSMKIDVNLLVSLDGN